jgi:ribosomal protein L44E
MNRDGDREVVREGRERQIRQDHRRVETRSFHVDRSTRTIERGGAKSTRRMTLTNVVVDAQ